VIAALGAQMLRLAGSQADGTVLWMTGPATVREHIVPVIAEAAESAGRPSPRVVCILPVCVTDDPDNARERAARVFAIYGPVAVVPGHARPRGCLGPGGRGHRRRRGHRGRPDRRARRGGVTDFVAGE